MSTHLLHIAVKLVEAMDKGAEESLPQEIADVVKLHAKLAVGSAWIPVPGADVAAGAANIWTMYLRINNKLGMKLGESVLKTIASAVATNLAGYAAVLAVGGFMKFIPGIGIKVPNAVPRILPKPFVANLPAAFAAILPAPLDNAYAMNFLESASAKK